MAMTTTQAERARALAAVRRGIFQCRKCRLGAGRRHAVPGEGPLGARVMFVGEAPGAREDASGRPFCGRAGEYLDRMLALAELPRDRVFITGSVKCRPPGNREPRRDELATCRGAWLERQLELVAPGLVVTLGGVGLAQVAGPDPTLAEVRGGLIHAHGRPVLPTYHPAAGMRFPRVARAMERDFETLGRLLAEGMPHDR